MLPLLFALAIVWIVATALSHLVFNIADSAGAFCAGSAKSELTAVNLGIPQPAKDFSTDTFCAPTGLAVKAGSIRDCCNDRCSLGRR